MQAFPFLIVGASSLVAAAVAWALATRRIPAPLAHPGARSLHRQPVPRVGGIAIWAGWTLAWPLTWPESALLSWSLLLPLALVIAVSLIDDYRGLLPHIRLLVHVAAAISVAMLCLGATGPMLVLDVLVIVWMANLYNFMDGADGLAGAMGVVGFGAFAVAALWSGQEPLSLLSAALAFACAGFLVFNLPPARLFMGDVGAIGLGFVAGAFGLKGWVDGAWPWWFPPLAFLPFIFDATLTLVRRIRRRAPLTVPHRDHFYQQSILKDGRHGPTVAAYAAWMAGSAAAGLGALRWAPQSGTLLGPILLAAMSAGFGWYCRSIDRRPQGAGNSRHGG